MYVEFEKLPEAARVWVYISDKPIIGDDKDWLASATKSFLEKWTAHGNNLQSSFTFLHDHILVIGLDENVADASGCSIDSSVHFIQGMAAHLGVDFFNRTLVPVLQNHVLTLINLADLKTKLSEEEIAGDTILFNTLISKKEDLKSASIPLRDSWLKRYLKIQDLTT